MSFEAQSVICDTLCSHDFEPAFWTQSRDERYMLLSCHVFHRAGRETAGATQKPVKKLLVLLAKLCPVAAPSAHPLVVNTHRS